MMWLMYRPVAVNAADAPTETKDPNGFTKRELALLTELLQTSNRGQHKQQGLTAITDIEERAA